MWYNKNDKPFSSVKMEVGNMSMYLNPKNTGFQMALNSEIYIDKSEIIKQTNNDC